MKPFNLPDLGEGLPDAEIVRWLVKEGDLIALDQPMVEMETAKAVVEVPSPMKGVVTKLGGKEGDVVEVGAMLVEFDGEMGANDDPAIEQDAAQISHNKKPISENSINDSSNSNNPISDKKATANAVEPALQTFHLPDLGEGLPDAEIVRWLVKQGDTLTIDQPMVEMETAKAVVEVPSPFAAKVLKLHGEAGEVIEVGAALISFVGEQAAKALETPNQSSLPASAQVEKDQVKQAQIPSSSKVDAATVVGAVEVGNKIVSESSSTVIKALARKLKVDLSLVTGTGSNGEITQSDVKLAKKNAPQNSDFSTKVTREVDAPNVAVAQSSGAADDNPQRYKASPAVRAYARRLGVPLSQCQASGSKNTISRRDVETASSSQSSVETSSTPVVNKQSATATSPTNGLPSVALNVEPQKIRGVRRAMAMGMAKSHATVVPTTLMEDADITAWPKQDALPRYVRALVFASKIEPALNAWFDGENFERLLHPQVSVGIAIDSPDGLYVPVVKQADSKTPEQIRADVQDLRKKIESKGLKQQDQQDATITLSNFGSIAGRYGTPVVSPPQVAILGTGRYRNELKLTDKGIENRKMLPLSLSFDHRGCTGGEAARFLAAVIQDLSKAN